MEVSDNGMQPQAIVIETAAFLREEGHVDPLPPYIAKILRRDGAVVSMHVSDDIALTTLLQTIVPQLDSPSYRLLRGRNETEMQHELCELLNSRLKLH